MKVKILFSFAFCLLTSVLHGQITYFQISDGSIIDSETNEKRKTKLMQAMMSSSTQKEAIITLAEKLREIRRSKDSLIFSSELQFDIDARKKLESKSFDPKDFIGKEFPVKNFKTLDNKYVSGMDFKGKPTLINF